MRPEESSLLTDLHGGMYEQPLWNGFLNRLRAQTGAVLTSLIFRPNGLDEDPVQLFSGAGPSPEQMRQFHETFERDPLPYHIMREGRVYAHDEMIDPASSEQRAFHDLMLSWGMSESRTVRISEPGGSNAWLGISGRHGHNWTSISALMTSLVPHFRIALRTHATMERERLKLVVNAEAFRRLDFGWLTLDAQCRIVDTSPHMEQLFRRSSVLQRGRYDRLTPASPQIDRELTALVRQFAQKRDTRPRAINLSRDPQMDMLVRPIVDRSFANPSPPVAVVYVNGDRWSQADRCDQLVDLFGLLPSEARLAWAIAQGRTIAQAARDLGITVETARNYSKKIYAKTGSRGQVELVRTILTGVLALA